MQSYRQPVRLLLLACFAVALLNTKAFCQTQGNIAQRAGEICAFAHQIRPEIQHMIKSNSVMQHEMGGLTATQIESGILNCEEGFAQIGLDHNPEVFNSAESVKDVLVPTNMYYIPFYIPELDKNVAMYAFTTEAGFIEFASFGESQYARLHDEAKSRINKLKESNPDDAIDCRMAGSFEGGLELLYCENSTQEEDYFVYASEAFERIAFPDQQADMPVKIDLEMTRQMLESVHQSVQQEAIVSETDAGIDPELEQSATETAEPDQQVDDNQQSSDKTGDSQGKVVFTSDGAYLDITDAISDTRTSLQDNVNEKTTATGNNKNGPLDAPPKHSGSLPTYIAIVLGALVIGILIFIQRTGSDSIDAKPGKSKPVHQ